MNFQYGLVVGSTIGGATQRVMVVAPADPAWEGRETWSAVVLRDDEPDDTLSWEPGRSITLSPDDRGITIIEEPE